MKKEKSCGCIIIKDKKVLLVYEKDAKFWGFPKGHMENGESELETAKREVLEEVGLEVILDEEKRYETSYIIKNKILKTAVFYIAYVKSGTIKKQESEIEAIKWCYFDEALKILSFPNLKKILEEVQNNLK